jgi:hypothetical protein
MVMGYPLEKWEIHWRLEILENVILHLIILIGTTVGLKVYEMQNCELTPDY